VTAVMPHIRVVDGERVELGQDSQESENKKAYNTAFTVRYACQYVDQCSSFSFCKHTLAQLDEYHSRFISIDKSAIYQTVKFKLPVINVQWPNYLLWLAKTDFDGERYE
jgi:hypothetical protein